ncbi:uncharacterized protein [Physcomitrium patens]|uniref:FG-GAP repeat-containing protein n=1 Tax=Physcomitrium patens TaxID=3218 RepID=A0A2K1JUM4_PHYPA|nr:uncharacterized protein LOC112288884 [Physcomitrium patens]PNR45217.1 hypothetical protein PHYPA_014988 [Physcomitrium patens]|eukprot:XP_024389347.1 uncharacterized protein LOC112288884 [Physcomitrella patens]
MRKRDLGILLLSALAIFFSLQHEGSLSFRQAWVHYKDGSPIQHVAERLPPPVVADLNGDGHVEVVVALEDKLQVIDPRVSFASDGFAEARVLAEVSLLPDRVRVGAGRRPVALAAGEVKRTYRSLERKKQVIVVVTAGWNIMCFDHNLKKIWEDDVQDDFPHGSHHKEVAISISNYTLKHGDTGLVIVGGSMEVQPQAHLDLFEEELLAEKATEVHQVSAVGIEEGEDVTEKMGGGKERHFSYYAYAGMTGARRWTHRSEDFQRAPGNGTLQPQHNYRLDANSLATRHLGEVECREFRESVLGVMPHRWEHREDTRFELSHFQKHYRKLVKRIHGKEKNVPSQKPADKNTPGKESLSNPITKVVGNAVQLAVGPKVRKERFQHVPMITNHTSHWWVPNVIVAHLKEGIEAVHLATGRTVCKLYLPEGGLHADINGDGVLDHVQAVGGHRGTRLVPTGMTTTLKPCWAIATSGVHVREQLFNGTVCRHSPFQAYSHFDFSGEIDRRLNPEMGDFVEVLAPIILPHPDGKRHRKGSHGDIIFLNSRGEVTSFSVLGPKRDQEAEHRWQLVTGAYWATSSELQGYESDRVVPSLTALPLRKNGEPEAILAIGEIEGVVISPKGSPVTEFPLPASASAPIIYADFSGDGLNDLILVTHDGIYGFVQARRPGAILFSTLVGVLILVMGVIFVTQHLGTGKGKSRPAERRGAAGI